MEIQLDAFKPATKVNTRVSLGQNFTGVKYRDKSFIFSNDLVKSTEVDKDDVSLKIEINPDTNQVLLLKVDGKSGNIFKRTDKTGLEKSKSFTSSVVEKALNASGLVTMGAEGSQYVDLVEATAGGKVVGYVIVAGGGSKNAPKATETPSVPTTPVAPVETTDELTGEDLIVDEIPTEAPKDEFEDNF